MKVRELMELLADCGPEAEVHIAYDYGDHSHTEVAPVVEDVSVLSVVHSDYHDMPKVCESGSGRAVVVLRG